MQKVDVQMSPKPYDTKRLFCSQGDTELRKFGFRLMDGLNEVDTSNISDPVFTSFPVHVGGTEELLPSSLLNGQVDLGSLTWSKGTYLSSSGIASEAKKPSSNSVAGNMYTSVYPTVARNSLAEKQISIQTDGSIVVLDSSYSTANEFKQAMQGVMLYFEKTDSTPTASPILADIQYPDGLREEESFTYRESPATVDGKAKVKVLKGNTLVWNQLFHVVNTASITQDGVTLTRTSDGKIVLNGTATADSTFSNIGRVSYFTNHIYFIKGSRANAEVRYPFSGPKDTGNGAITTFTNGGTEARIIVKNGTTYTNYEIYPQMVDLTKMFGAGNEPTTVDEFTSLFSNSYYPYTTGTLLDFKGTELKTVGFNQWDGETESGYIYNGTPYASNDYWRTKNYIPVIPNETYYFNVPSTNGQIALYDVNKRYVSSVNNMGGSSHLVTIPNGCHFARFYQPVSSDSSAVCVNISGDKDGQYEPYTESTTSLPTLTYFPTGMKSAGSVRDELSDNKATTRVGTLVLNGTESWTRTSANNYYFQANYIARALDYTQTMSSDKATVINNAGDSTTNTAPIWIAGYAKNSSYQGQNWLYMHNDSISTLNDFKTWLQANPVTINYELATSSEESIMSASLVTENAEIPLYVSDEMLVGDCTEELSASAGILDAKIKFTDADGDCYSNKLKISVEARP